MTRAALLTVCLALAACAKTEAPRLGSRIPDLAPAPAPVPSAPPPCIDATSTREPRGPTTTRTVRVASPAARAVASEAPRAVQTSADGTRLLVVRSDEAAFVVDARAGRRLSHLEGTPAPHVPNDAYGQHATFTLADDGTRVVGVGWGRGVHGWDMTATERMWNADTGALLSTRRVVVSASMFRATPSLRARAVWFNGYFTDAGGSLLVLAGTSARDASRIGDGVFHDAAWNDAGTRIATTRDRSTGPLGNRGRAPLPSTLTMWRTEGRAEPLWTTALDHGAIAGFTGDGALLVTSAAERMVVHDAASGRVMATLAAHGELLASSRRDVVVLKRTRDVVVLDATTGDERRTVPLGRTGGATLRPDGRALALFAGDGSARVCIVDLDAGRASLDVVLPAEALAWSRDGGTLFAVATEDDAVRVRALALADERTTEVAVTFSDR